jgi:broad specificity phosphatase PhoE
LERAQETADAIASRHQVEITTDERLIESDTTLEGVGKTVVAFLRSPKHWWALRNPWRPSWGETFVEIKVRMMAAIDDAVASSEGREIVIVSHQTPVMVARAALSQRRGPPWLGGGPCTTGSITSLEMEGASVVGASYFAAPV